MRQATKERQARMLSELLDKKHVTVKRLAENMAVSEATVRRDLKTLADDRKVHLFHGGAMLPSTADFSFQANKIEINRPSRSSASWRRAWLPTATSFSRFGHHQLCPGRRAGSQAWLVDHRKFRAAGTGAEIAGDEPDHRRRAVSAGPHGHHRPDRHSTLDQLRGYTAFIGADGLSWHLVFPRPTSKARICIAWLSPTRGNRAASGPHEIPSRVAVQDCGLGHDQPVVTDSGRMMMDAIPRETRDRGDLSAGRHADEPRDTEAQRQEAVE